MITMYARDSKGKIKEWNTEVKVGPSNEVYIQTMYGLVDGQLQINNDYITEGKNLGKSNETTPYDQAVFEMNSKIEDQRKKGYKTLIDLGLREPEGLNQVARLITMLDNALPKDNTDNNDNIIPMKCQKYWKDEEETIPRIKFPCIGQPKINGVRCIILWENDKVVIRSKKGLDYTVLEHIEKIFTKDMFFQVGKYGTINIVYDGELYSHGSILSDIVSAVRVRTLLTQHIEFWCFDLAIPELDNEDRNLLRLFKLDKTSKPVVCVIGDDIMNPLEAIDYAESRITSGFEGAIFRDPNALYGFGKRPQTIVKYKKYLDGEFEIIDVIPQEKRPDLALFVLNSKGGQFKCNPEGSVETRQKYLVDRKLLIGKLATIKFYEWSVNNIPFHAKMIAVRNYE
jgi:DNA ligase 1